MEPREFIVQHGQRIAQLTQDLQGLAAAHQEALQQHEQLAAPVRDANLDLERPKHMATASPYETHQWLSQLVQRTTDPEQIALACAMAGVPVSLSSIGNEISDVDSGDLGFGNVYVSLDESRKVVVAGEGKLSIARMWFDGQEYDAGDVFETTGTYHHDDGQQHELEVELDPDDLDFAPLEPHDIKQLQKMTSAQAIVDMGLSSYERLRGLNMVDEQAALLQDTHQDLDSVESLITDLKHQLKAEQRLHEKLESVRMYGDDAISEVLVGSEGKLLDLQTSVDLHRVEMRSGRGDVRAHEAAFARTHTDLNAYRLKLHDNFKRTSPEHLAAIGQSMPSAEDLLIETTQRLAKLSNSTRPALATDTEPEWPTLDTTSSQIRR